MDTKNQSNFSFQFYDEQVTKIAMFDELPTSEFLELAALLERNVRDEMDKVMKKPNRATKLVSQVRKRLSLLKTISVLMDDTSHTRTRVFPTFGLLCMHVIHLTLNSSIMKKASSRAIALELYMFLKLVFEEDLEFVLDVVLCCDFADQKSSSFQVGFNVFTLIMKDSCEYAAEKSSLMKYCGICAILMKHDDQDKALNWEALPTKEILDKAFMHFLNQKLFLDCASTNVSTTDVLSVIRNIDPSKIKLISKQRLVGVTVTRQDSPSDHCPDTLQIVTEVSNTRTIGTQHDLESSQSKCEQKQNEHTKGIQTKDTFHENITHAETQPSCTTIESTLSLSLKKLEIKRNSTPGRRLTTKTMRVIRQIRAEWLIRYYRNIREGLRTLKTVAFEHWLTEKLKRFDPIIMNTDVSRWIRRQKWITEPCDSSAVPPTE